MFFLYFVGGFFVFVGLFLMCLCVAGLNLGGDKHLDDVKLISPVIFISIIIGLAIICATYFASVLA